MNGLSAMESPGDSLLVQIWSCKVWRAPLPADADDRHMAGQDWSWFLSELLLLSPSSFSCFLAILIYLKNGCSHFLRMDQCHTESRWVISYAAQAACIVCVTGVMTGIDTLMLFSDPDTSI